MRVAVIGLTGEHPHIVEGLLTEALRLTGRVTTIDRSISEPAIKAIGYDGSINMSTEDARKVGASVGCDFFITGKAEVVARSIRPREVHHEAILAILIVDGRNGSLALFDLVTATGGTPQEATNLANRSLSQRASSYLKQLLEYRKVRARLDPSDRPAERIEDMTVEGSSQSVGFSPPEFLNRLKPEYTAQAERADISATVELMVVLKSNGEIGDVEVVRWAGFGLDESAVATVRKLEFKPATREGKPVSVRALIRYNFRRK